jgi:hypothetical protein
VKRGGVHPRHWLPILAVVGASAGAAPDCTPQPPAAAPVVERFRDNGDGTVTDLRSQLMWMRCSSGQRWQAGRCAGTASALSWRDAQRVAGTLNREATAFYNDWRLPTLRELATITERGCTIPRTDAAIFPDTAPAAFWSATPRPGEAEQDRVFALGFGADGVLLARKDELHHLRLVRNGP